jgi:hypothetical protein
MVLKVPAGEEQVGIPGARAKRPVAADATISNPESWSCQHLLNFITGASWFTQCSLLLGDDVFELERGVKVFLGQRMPAQFMVVGEEITVQCKDGLAVFKLVDPG